MTNTHIYTCPADKTPYVMLALYVKAQQYSRGQRTQCNYNNISMGAREVRGERGVGVARLVPGRKRRIRIALGTSLLTLSPNNVASRSTPTVTMFQGTNFGKLPTSFANC